MSAKPRIALVHDWFNTKPGGAERVILELADMFPDSPVYTLIYNQRLFKDMIDPSRLRTSMLQKLPSRVKSKPRYLLPLIPAAVKSLRIRGFDIVISSSSAFVKNIATGFDTTHICYCHTPARFAWDYQAEYLEEQRVDPMRRQAAEKLVKLFQRWDLRGSAGVNIWVANSKTTATRIKRYYGKTAQIVYPPVETSHFKPATVRDDYYLTLSALTPYKRVELAIEACNVGGRQLYVVGEGPQRPYLEGLAGPTVQFTGYVSEAKKRQLLGRAKGLIYANEEDFGIAPVEAMAAGTPVIAYAKGGVTETVIDGKTGLLFSKQTREGLAEALDRFETMSFDTSHLTKRAKQFDRAIFRRKMQAIVETVDTSNVQTESISEN